jgi:hypothetical protein
MPASNPDQHYSKFLDILGRRALTSGGETLEPTASLMGRQNPQKQKAQVLQTDQQKNQVQMSPSHALAVWSWKATSALSKPLRGKWA